MYVKGGLPSENLLTKVWKGQHIRQNALVTDDGRAIHVVFPGRRNSDQGPDFHSAILATDEGQLIKGTVEIHVLSSDWVTHGHHLDPAYDNLSLHVVWRRDNERPTMLARGTAVPTVSLEGCADLEAALLPAGGPQDGRLCLRRNPGLGPQETAWALDEAGDARFAHKAAAMESEIAGRGPEQALYQGMMEALGYSKNKEPFRELAEAMPVAALYGLVAGKPPARRLEVLQALLFGAAGLLPGQRGMPVEGSFPRVLEGVWRRYGGGAHMPASRWRLFRVRPENVPTRRIAAAAHLLERYGSRGLVGGLHGCVAEGTAEELCQALTSTSDGYWARHLDFGTPWRPNPTLVGRGRAAEMAVNAVLPFFHAMGRYQGLPGLEARALEVFQGFPRLAGNHITAEMEAQLFPNGGRKVVNSARRQQGLIHFYKSMCLGLRCQGCVLGDV